MSHAESNPGPEIPTSLAPRCGAHPSLAEHRPAGRALPIAMAFASAILFGAAAAAGTCQPPQELRERLNELDPSITGCRPDLSCWEGVPEALAELARAHPEVLRAQTAHLAALRNEAGDAEARKLYQDGYRKQAEAEPESVLAQYLLGRALWGMDEGRRALERALELDPDHASSLLSLAALDSQKEPEKAKEGLLRFRQLCPDRPMGVVSVASRLPGTVEIELSFEQLRSEIVDLPEAEQIHALGYFWALQFSHTPVAGHAALRQQIAEDVKKVEAWNRTESPRWWSVLEQGYEVAGQHEKLAELKKKKAERNPCARDVVMAALRELRPKGAAEEPSVEETESLVASYQELNERCPGDWMIQMSLLGTAAKAPTEVVSDQRLIELGDAYLESRAAAGSSVRSARSPQMTVAKIFLERGIALERTVTLLAEARAEQAKRDAEKDSEESRPLPAKMEEMLKLSAALTPIDMDLMEGKALLGLGRLDEASELLKRAHGGFDAVAALPGGTDRLAGVENRYAELRENLAAARGVDSAKLDLPSTTAREELAPVELMASMWEELDEPLAPFFLQDLDGQTWTVDDLKGKATLINIWATWCGPCRAELPHIQKIHEEWQGRDDVRVLTFDMDRNIGAVAPYLEKEGYDFPVLLALDYLQSLDVFGIPQTWLIDPEGKVRKKNMGFGEEMAEAWVEDVKKQVEKLAAEKGAP